MSGGQQPEEILCGTCRHGVVVILADEETGESPDVHEPAREGVRTFCSAPRVAGGDGPIEFLTRVLRCQAHESDVPVKAPERGGRRA